MSLEITFWSIHSTCFVGFLQLKCKLSIRKETLLCFSVIRVYLTCVLLEPRLFLHLNSRLYPHIECQFMTGKPKTPVIDGMRLIHPITQLGGTGTECLLIYDTISGFALWTLKAIICHDQPDFIDDIWLFTFLVELSCLAVGFHPSVGLCAFFIHG